MKRLHSLETREVSIVPKGANKKKWLVLKSAIKKNPVGPEDLKKIVGDAPDVMSKVDDVIKAYNEGLGHGIRDEEAEVGEDLEKGQLSAEGRKHIDDKNFAIPSERKYPIHDVAHARNALSRVAQNGTPEEKSKVKAAVHRKYPELAKTEKAEYCAPEKGQLAQSEAQMQEPLDAKAQASLKAVVRILAPHKDKLDPVLLKSVLDAAGFQLAAGESDGGEDMATKQGSNRQSPEPVKDEHKIEAMKIGKEAAKKAYDQHLEKLGYQKYPEAEMQQKAVNTDPDEPAQDDEQEGLEHNPDKEPGMEVQHKSVKKSLDLSKLPKEARPAVEQIFKAHQELVEKNESLSKEVEGLRTRELRREFVGKAESMKHLGIEQNKLVDTLIALSRKAPEEFAEIEKALVKGAETIQKSALFSEVGSSLSNNGVPTYEQMVAAAQTLVQKSGEKVSDAEAFDRFTQTTEGRRMYADYLKQHPSQKGN